MSRSPRRSGPPEQGAAPTSDSNTVPETADVSANPLLQRLRDVLRERGHRTRKQGAAAFRVQCPVHSGVGRSSVIFRLERDGRASLERFCGCPEGDLLAALGLRRSDLRPPAANTGDDGGSGVIRMSSVPVAPVRFLWHGYLPRGKQVIMDGDPGQGKSTLTIDIIARVTTGKPMPDNTPGLGEPAAVVLLSAEDDGGDTIRPRLEAAGADLDKVILVKHFDGDDGQPRLPELPRDVPKLKKIIEQLGAALLVVDPLFSFIGETVNSRLDPAVRRALYPLKELAEDTGVTVWLVRHMNKNESTHALYRGGESIAFTAASRVAMLVATDPDDPEHGHVLAVAKANLTERPSSLRYRLREVTEPVKTTCVEWLGPSRHDANALLRLSAPERLRKVDEAAEWLDDQMWDGAPDDPDRKRVWRWSIDIKNAAGKRFNERLLQRAIRRIGGESTKRGMQTAWSPRGGPIPPEDARYPGDES